jgi:serine/threonine-protein kinase HipA
MKRLHVYLNGATVGTLKQNDSGLLEFCYGAEWLAKPDATPLSRSLPLQAETFRGKHARAFFAGMLPEEGPRQQIAAILGISERNDFAMLECIGGECAGAVSLLPEGMPLPDAGKTRELRGQELQGIIAELHRRPLMAGREGVRLSLAGAQDKLPVVMHGSRMALPLGNTPSTHIIKPEPDMFPGLVANEVFCMTLAKAVGLKVPRVEARLIGGRACIVVERYDRLVSPEKAVTRLHQEDFCQALGVPPEKKYQQEGGPLLRDCIALIRDWSTAPALDIRDFLDGLIFNVQIGNADAHGKNYSFLYQGKSRRLAPFYDLICTLAWSELSKTPAMKIGQSESMERITSANWQKMAAETGVGWPMLRERIADLSHKTLAALQDADVRKAANDAATVERIAGIIEARTTSLLSMDSPE